MHGHIKQQESQREDNQQVTYSDDKDYSRLSALEY